MLRSLGHEIVWDPKNDKFLTGDSGINLIVEGFSPASIASIAEGRAGGARFLMLATEEPTPKGFNHGTQKEMVQRQELFPEAARMCEGIVHLVPGEHVTRWYAQFAPAAPAELGFAPTLVRKGPDVEPDYDFGFFGSLSKRRLKILKRLAKMVGTVKAVKLVADFAPQADRDREMKRARVIVQLRKFDEMGLVSSSRCNTALCIGRPVVAEPHEMAQEWDKIVRFSKTPESFYTDAMTVRAAWRWVHNDQFSKFKATMTPERCIGRALEEIGLFTNRRAA